MIIGREHTRGLENSKLQRSDGRRSVLNPSNFTYKLSTWVMMLEWMYDSSAGYRVAIYVDCISNTIAGVFRSAQLDGEFLN